MHDRLSKPVDIRSESWVFAWLSLTPGAAAFWNDVADAFASKGIQLVAAIEHYCEAERSQLRFPHVRGELWSTVGIGLEASRVVRAQRSELVEKIALECARRDRCFWVDHPVHGSLDELAGGGVAVIEALCGPAVACCPPVAAIVWNSSGSSSHAACEFFADRGVPVCFAERGPLTPCMFIDRLGLNGLSERVRDRRWIERWASCASASIETSQRGERIASLIASRRSQNWSPRAHWSLGGVEDSSVSAESMVGADGGPAAWSGDVVYFACMEPHAIHADLRRCAEVGLPFGDSYRAAEFLLRACRREGLSARTVIKPHPLERSPDRYNWICRSLGGRVSTRVDVYEAVDRGDVIVTTSESVAWLASMLGGRVLSLGLTPVGLAGAIEEPAAQHTLNPCAAPSVAVLTDIVRRALRSVTTLSTAEMERRRRVALACVANLAPVMCTRDEALQDLGLSAPAQAAECVLEIARATAGMGERSVVLRTHENARSAIAALLRSAEELGYESFDMGNADQSTSVELQSVRPVRC